jgi:hypothetical protein
MSEHNQKGKITQVQTDATSVPGFEDHRDGSKSHSEQATLEAPEVKPKPRPRITRAEVDVSQEYAAGMELRSTPTQISLRKPFPTEWVRVRAGEKWTATLALVEVKLEDRTETYLIWGRRVHSSSKCWRGISATIRCMSV